MLLTEELLRELRDHLMEMSRDMERDKKPAPLVKRVRKLARQIEVIGFHPQTFNTIVTQELHPDLVDFKGPLQRMPLLLDSADPLLLTIVKWRLANRV